VTFGQPPRSKSIDQRSLVAGLDPDWQRPPEVYLYPNGRKFNETVVPSTEALVAGTVYAPSGTTNVVYQVSKDAMTLYGAH
jgi:hypothetical protein